MPNWLDRLTGGRFRAPERKSAQVILSLSQLGEAQWTRRGFASLANEGFLWRRSMPVDLCCIGPDSPNSKTKCAPSAAMAWRMAARPTGWTRWSGR